MIVLSYPSHHLFAADVAAGRPSKVDGENDLVIGPYVQSQAFLFALLAIRSLQTRLPVVTSRKDGTPYDNKPRRIAHCCLPHACGGPVPSTTSSI